MPGARGLCAMCTSLARAWQAGAAAGSPFDRSLGRMIGGGSSGVLIGKERGKGAVAVARAVLVFVAAHLSRARDGPALPCLRRACCAQEFARLATDERCAGVSAQLEGRTCALMAQALQTEQATAAAAAAATTTGVARVARGLVQPPLPPGSQGVGTDSAPGATTSSGPTRDESKLTMSQSDQMLLQKLAGD
eukprot:COSAG01_NODE_3750_length_5733_cov_22.729322_8_plen_192_part_00